MHIRFSDIIYIFKLYVYSLAHMYTYIPHETPQSYERVATPRLVGLYAMHMHLHTSPLLC